MSRLIRTAFTLPDRARWTGGYQYFVNLFRVLASHGSGRVRPVVYCGPQPGAEIEALRADGAVEMQPRIAAGLASAVLLGRDFGAARSYRDQSIRVAFESARYHGWNFPLPTVAWLPDFQHRLLPRLFGPAAWLHREFGFRAQISAARVVMLSSHSSREECERFYPSSRSRTRVVRFAAELPPEAHAVPAGQAMRKYDLPAEYFYLPNQFWVHKNHRVIIDALHLLRQQGRSLTVAASGAAADPRRPGLPGELQEGVAELGLQAQFRFLGLVPREDLYALMRGAVAVVNPSLSEGWSSTVEEARSLGAYLLLSRIPVHREQAADVATFFDPHSAQEAARAMSVALDRWRAAGSREAVAVPRVDLDDRLARFAAEFEALVAEVAG